MSSRPSSRSTTSTTSRRPPSGRASSKSNSSSKGGSIKGGTNTRPGSRSTKRVTRKKGRRAQSATRPSDEPPVFPEPASALLYFPYEDEELGSEDELPEHLQASMVFRTTSTTPNVVKNVLRKRGFRLFKNTTNDWMGTWGRRIAAEHYRGFHSFRKANHFPGTQAVGCKDKLYRNLIALRRRCGAKHVSFLPQTYILPAETNAFVKDFESKKGLWILKPCAAARGKGIRVVSELKQVPKSKRVLMQRYISNPLLINDRKFDLRIYVLVTCFDPLKVYVFPDGLVRFASTAYKKGSSHVHNREMHLTNYSIQKHADGYVDHEDDDKGSKWTISALKAHFAAEGIDDSRLWPAVNDLIVKTLIAVEPQVMMQCSLFVKEPQTAYELFGFDVLLDDKLKPWLLEVNISPSLHSKTRLDKTLKTEMVTDIFNMVLFHAYDPDRLAYEREQDRMMRQFRSRNSGEELAEKTKQKEVMSGAQLPLEGLTAKDVGMIETFLMETERAGSFELLYPRPENVDWYARFFERPRYGTTLLAEFVRCGFESVEQIQELYPSSKQRRGPGPQPPSRRSRDTVFQPGRLRPMKLTTRKPTGKPESAVKRGLIEGAVGTGERTRQPVGGLGGWPFDEGVGLAADRDAGSDGSEYYDYDYEYEESGEGEDDFYYSDYEGEEVEDVGGGATYGRGGNAGRPASAAGSSGSNNNSSNNNNNDNNTNNHVTASADADGDEYTAAYDEYEGAEGYTEYEIEGGVSSSASTGGRGRAGRGGGGSRASSRQSESESRSEAGDSAVAAAAALDAGLRRAARRAAKGKGVRVERASRQSAYRPVRPESGVGSSGGGGGGESRSESAGTTTTTRSTVAAAAGGSRGGERVRQQQSQQQPQASQRSQEPTQRVGSRPGDVAALQQLQLQQQQQQQQQRRQHGRECKGSTPEWWQDEVPYVSDVANSPTNGASREGVGGSDGDRGVNGDSSDRGSDQQQRKTVFAVLRRPGPGSLDQQQQQLPQQQLKQQQQQQPTTQATSRSGDGNAGSTYTAPRSPASYTTPSEHTFVGSPDRKPTAHRNTSGGGIQEPFDTVILVDVESGKRVDTYTTESRPHSPGRRSLNSSGRSEQAWSSPTRSPSESRRVSGDGGESATCTSERESGSRGVSSGGGTVNAVNQHVYRQPLREVGDKQHVSVRDAAAAVSARTDYSSIQKGFAAQYNNAQLRSYDTRASVSPPSGSTRTSPVRGGGGGYGSGTYVNGGGNESGGGSVGGPVYASRVNNGFAAPANSPVSGVGSGGRGGGVGESGSVGSHQKRSYLDGLQQRRSSPPTHTVPEPNPRATTRTATPTATASAAGTPAANTRVGSARSVYAPVDHVSTTGMYTRTESASVLASKRGGDVRESRSSTAHAPLRRGNSGVGGSGGGMSGGREGGVSGRDGGGVSLPRGRSFAGTSSSGGSGTRGDTRGTRARDTQPLTRESSYSSKNRVTQRRQQPKREALSYRAVSVVNLGEYLDGL